MKAELQEGGGKYSRRRAIRQAEMLSDAKIFNYRDANLARRRSIDYAYWSGSFRSVLILTVMLKETIYLSHYIPIPFFA